MKNAIILCSGGLDSVVTAFYAKKILKRKLSVLFFDYKQNNLKEEKKSVEYFAKKLNSRLIEIKLPKIYSSKKVPIPKTTLKNTKAESDKWYIPQRNLIFLSIAGSIAESLSMKNKAQYEIFTGFKSEGKEPFPDATKEFVKNFNKLIKNSSKNKISIKAPLIKKDKEDIIQLGKKLKVELEKTFSCYAPTKNKHCGICLACRLRKAGFYWANEEDKTAYAN